MAKTELEKHLEEATAAFALKIVDAIRQSTLEELIQLQSAADVAPVKRRGRPPGRKSAQPVVVDPAAPPKRKRGRPPKNPVAIAAVEGEEAPKKKKRVVKNYPKCAYPRCNQNRFVRGKGFCGKHWKMYLAGEIKSADEYKNK